MTGGVLRWLLRIGLLMSVGGCAPSPDADQIRLCRIALVALVDRDATLSITNQSPIAAVRDQTAVRVQARVTTADERSRTVFAECRFAAGPTTTGVDTLVAIRTDTGALSDTGLFFLKRFWLASPEADRSDPEPIALWSGAPTLPLPLAHGLQNALGALPGLTIYGLLAAAYSLVYGLVGRINLAFGAMAAIGGASGLTALGGLAHPEIGSLIAVAVLAALWAGTLHGVAIARWVFLPLTRATGQQSLVATIGLALVLGEYLRLAQGATPLWIAPLRAAPLGIARADQFVVTVTPLALSVTAVFAGGSLLIIGLVHGTQFGRNWRAMADDAAAAALMGVDPTRMFVLTFALASGLAGIAGAVTVLVYGSFGASYGTVLGLKALLAAILGGIGSVPGAFLGGIAIAAMEAAWSAFFPIEYRDLALFIVLSATLVARPGGFLGFRELGPRRI